jgi:hypothetical protein
MTILGNETILGVLTEIKYRYPNFGTMFTIRLSDPKLDLKESETFPLIRIQNRNIASDPAKIFL